jgi:DNA-binding NarL/FixJ family response regulator
LAPIYGRVLDLLEAGASNEAIAAVVGISVEAVPALVDVATRKEANRAGARRAPEEAS